MVVAGWYTALAEGEVEMEVRLHSSEGPSRNIVWASYLILLRALCVSAGVIVIWGRGD